MPNKFLQFLGLTKRSGNLIEGYNKCEEAVKSNSLHLLIISSDCSENTKEKFMQYSNKYDVPLIEVPYGKEELGSSIGRAEINVLGVADKNMSLKLMTLIKE